MKRYTRSILALAGLLLLGTAAALNAQTSNTVTDVPFAFSVGTTALPRDTYHVSRLPGQSGAFLIRGTREGVVVLSQPDGPSDGDKSPRLVFHRYADRYFLREVRMANNLGFMVPRTRAERDAEERIAGQSAPEVVVLPTRPQ